VYLESSSGIDMTPPNLF